jgi:hypothetical protein
MSLEPPFFFATWSREPFEKFPKELPHFEEFFLKLSRFLEDLGRF